MSTVTIGGIPVGDDYPCRVCAEVGTNPSGSVRIARDLIQVAKNAGADFVKFQARTPHLAVPEAEWNELRDTPWGKMTKLEYREAVEFQKAYLIHLFQDMIEQGVEFGHADTHGQYREIDTQEDLDLAQREWAR